MLRILNLERGQRQVRALLCELRDQVAALRAALAGAAAPSPRGCLADIMGVLAKAGRRLTTTRILDALAAAGHEWSETTVKHTLAAAVAAGGLTNERHAEPRGYGLVAPRGAVETDGTFGV
jgi:hypothetical protein